MQLDYDNAFVGKNILKRLTITQFYSNLNDEWEDACRKGRNAIWL